MNSNNQTQSLEESRAALDTVHQAQAALHKRVRSPLWLTVIAASSLAGMLLGNWFGDDSLWESITSWLAFLVFFGTWAIYLLVLRRRGMRMRFVPSSAAGLGFLVFQAIFYLGLIFLTEWLMERGMTFAPWAATAVICLSFALVLHLYPTGEPIPKAKRR